MEDNPAFDFETGLAASSFVPNLPMVIEDLTDIELPEGIDAFLGIGGSINGGISIDDTDPISGGLLDSLTLVGELTEDSDSLNADSVLGAIGNSFGSSILPAVNTVADNVATEIATEILEEELGPFIAPIAGGIIGGVAGNIAENIAGEVLTPTDDGMDIVSSATEPVTGILGLLF